MTHTYEFTLKIAGTYTVPDPWNGDYWGCGPTCSYYECEQDAIVVCSSPSLMGAIDAILKYNFAPETFEPNGSIRITGIKYLFSESRGDDTIVELEYLEEIPQNG